jgi:acetoin utilization deacetylase AcuC-like enzyme
LQAMHPAPAEKADLSMAHTASSIQLVHDTAPSTGIVSLDADTSMNAHSLDAALLAAGAGLAATKAVLEGKINNAFCAVRPPGHHAEHDLPRGLCVFMAMAQWIFLLMIRGYWYVQVISIPTTLCAIMIPWLST